MLSMSIPQKITLAIADDHDFVREVTVAAIENSGPFVFKIKAKDGLELIQQLITTPVDAIILDLKMPLMDGEEVLNYIQKQGLKSKIILYSMYEFPEIRSSYTKLGAHAYLTKEAESNEIAQTILNLFNIGT